MTQAVRFEAFEAQDHADSGIIRQLTYTCYMTPKTQQGYRWVKKGKQVLGDPWGSAGPYPESLEGDGANTVGAPVHAEEKALGSQGGDQVASAPRADAPVLVMPFHVMANVLETAKNHAAGTEKEIVGDHVAPLQAQ